MDLIIRLMQPQHLAEASRVWHESRSVGEPWLPGRPLAHSEAELREIDRRYTVWIAVDGAAVRGLMAIGPSYVDQLYVKPGHWARGIGTLLLDHAKRLMPSGFVLFVNEQNERARRFYEARGLVDVERLQNPHGQPSIRFVWRP